MWLVAKALSTATYTCQNKYASDLGARAFKISIDDSIFTLITTDDTDVKQKAELTVMTTRR